MRRGEREKKRERPTSNFKKYIPYKVLILEVYSEAQIAESPTAHWHCSSRNDK